MSTIVSAVGVAVSRHNTSEARAKTIEEAMSAAVLAAHAQGITDHDKIRELMLEARDMAIKKIDGV